MNVQNVRTAWLTVVLGAICSPLFVAAAGTPESMEFEYRNISSLEINAGIFDVTVRSAPGNSVSVTVSDIPRGFRVSEQERFNTAAVSIRGRNTWLSRAGKSPTIDIILPSGIDLDVASVSGSISVDGARGSIALRSTSGSITAKRAGGEVAVETASGNVGIDEVTGTLRFETASGNVTIERFRGTLDGRTASGAIEGTSLQLIADTRLRSASGDITIDVDNDLRDFRYILRSTSGRVVLGNLRGERTLQGGNGRFLIDAVTASGSIVIR
ncbi:MAG: DUF4097 family beta strand repeat-containing protein [Alkalispirochaeta sp.]